MDEVRPQARAHALPIGQPSRVPMPGTVAAVMSHPLITVDVAVSLEQAYARMRDEGVHHLLLTDRGRVVAMVSDRNLIRALGLGPSQRETDSRYRRHPVLQVASYQLVTVDESAPVETAAVLMLDAGVSGLPVVNEASEVVGILTSRDLLRYVADLGRRSSKADLRRAS